MCCPTPTQSCSTSLSNHPCFHISPSPVLNAQSLFAAKCRPSFHSSKHRVANSARSKKMASQEANDFYLVRKGDLIGIYKTLSDCQAQLGDSVCDPPMTVYKGYGMSKEAEQFLRSHGLSNASYCVTVDDAKVNLYGKFGALIPCPFQQPVSFGKDDVTPVNESSPETWWQEANEIMDVAEQKVFSSSPMLSQDNIIKPEPDMDISTGRVGNVTASSSRETIASIPLSSAPNNRFHESNSSINYNETSTVSATCDTCTIEFDGACKGNPGKAGAGALLRAADGRVVWRLREGVGSATNNIAEYRALILGLRHALKQGFKNVRATGDSKLVVMQVNGTWKIKMPHLVDLCKTVNDLKKKFVSFQLTHVLREFNSAADAQANGALNLEDGQVEEDCQRT